MKKNSLIVVIILFIVFTGGGYIFLHGETDEVASEELEDWDNLDDPDESMDDSKDNESSLIEIKEIQVYICGAVKKPGVYIMEDGMRLNDLLELCGGTLKDADLDSVNLAGVVADGEKIYIMNTKEAKQQKKTPSMESADKTKEEDNRININTAEREALMTLPGIGEAKAESIIRYRETQKPFETTSDIMNIEGIKEGVYEKIKDRITV